MSLCTICQPICADSKWGNEEIASSPKFDGTVVWLFKDNEREIMHGSWEIFLVSLSQDCPICWSIWRILRSSPLAKPTDETQHDFQTRIYYMACNLIQNLHTPETVAELVQKCSQRNSPGSIPPTRLLDIGTSCSNQWVIVQTAETTPKLLHTGGYQAQRAYQDRQLPQHFQDIISICRAMAIRYLWIDSLCIFQDSDDDFRREAGIMADIYENAFLTLSICWDYSSTGLFREIRPQTIPRTPSADHLASRGKEAQVPAPRSGSRAFVQHEWSFRIDLSDALINRRGWVVQERFLSPKIVYLGNEQVYWECNAHIASEAVPHKLNIPGKRTSSQFNGDIDETNHVSWSSVMEAYSNCTLTRKQDKLIAISGLAKSLSKKSGHTYFSGIWIEHWIQDLLWFPNMRIVYTADEATKTMPLGDNLGAPSWLWAGFPSDIIAHPGQRQSEFTSSNLCSFKSKNAFALAKLTSWTLNSLNSSDDTFTSFTGARLNMTCFLIPLDFDKKALLERISALKHGAIVNWQEDEDDKAMHLPSTHLRLRVLSEATARCSAKANKLVLRFSERFDPSLPCFFMPLLASTRIEAPSHCLDPCLHGLVVQEIHKGQRQFIRIACLTEYYGSRGFGITAMILNSVTKQGLTVHKALSTTEEEEFKIAFRQYAAIQVSSEIHLDCIKDKTVPWSEVLQIKDLSWLNIQLV
ncbi:heterokaryon incompatibility protein-domain-containing protein [Fusarium sp. MPI-SDFR-AT-0072]|nr:heterokaryon incompatibility protein-domain-containing protein [Fusarium sp. MPI-SDFR-AT-0072]